MGTIIKIDRFQRNIISILFRLVISLYALFLILSNVNSFNWYLNLSVFIVYWVIFILLWRGNGWKSILRITIDFCFIFFILYQQQSFGFLEYSLLFAPVLNCQNHSSDKRTILVYIYPLIIIYLITKKVEYLYILPFILFFIINSFESIRTKYFKFIENLNSLIDNFFIQNLNQKKPYSIYKESIPVFNDSKLFPFKISAIFCFRIFNDKISIINGSSFIWSMHIDEYSKFKKYINDAEESGYYFNLKLMINKEKLNSNLVLFYHINNSYYCYVLSPEKTNIYLSLKIPFFLPKLVQPFFHRLTKVFESDLNQKSLNYEEIKKIAEKYFYVNKAEKAMHHIRNHLTPFKNLAALTQNINTITNEEIKNKLIDNLRKDANSIQTSLPEILERVDLILDKAKNPFNVSNLDTIGIQKLYSKIKNIWSFHFDEENLIVNWDTSKDRLKADVSINSEGLDLILSNWLSNVEKYHTKQYGINFNEDKDFYIVSFYNSFQDKNSISTLLEIFNATDKSQVFRNSNHGIFQIKECVEQMNLISKLYLDNELLTFELYFKKEYLDENTSI